MYTAHLGLRPQLLSRKEGGPSTKEELPIPIQGSFCPPLCMSLPQTHILPLWPERLSHGSFLGTFSFLGERVGKTALGKDLRAELLLLVAVGAPEESSCNENDQLSNVGAPSTLDRWSGNLGPWPTRLCPHSGHGVGIGKPHPDLSQERCCLGVDTVSYQSDPLFLCASKVLKSNRQ